MKALDKGWVVESYFWLSRTWRERRAAHEEVRLEVPFECHARHSCRCRRDAATVVRIGLVQFRGRSFAEADRICDPVETLVSGRAANLNRTQTSAI